MACAAASYNSGSWPSQHKEARAALRYIHTRYPNNKVGVLGHSSGSSLASFLWATELIPDVEIDPNMIPPLGPYPSASLKIDAAVLMSGQFHPYPINTPPCTQAQVWNKTLDNSACEYNYTLGNYSAAQKVNPALYLSSFSTQAIVPAPAMIFHGTNDSLVSACNAVELAQAVENTSFPSSVSSKDYNYTVHLRLIQNASHGSYLETAYPIAATFLAKHLCPTFSSDAVAVGTSPHPLCK
mmetsp:Transcript_7569/g.11353  ORF Transcript_7569/g.11353 Transcript_7569/m.11353 type:complete len:240 (-) Transcript_7569:825-1544(-)